jgi:hypothetical protein
MKIYELGELKQMMWKSSKIIESDDINLKMKVIPKMDFAEWCTKSRWRRKTVT